MWQSTSGSEPVARGTGPVTRAVRGAGTSGTRGVAGPDTPFVEGKSTGRRQTPLAGDSGLNTRHKDRKEPVCLELFAFFPVVGSTPENSVKTVKR